MNSFSLEWNPSTLRPPPDLGESGEFESVQRMGKD
ncbi:hypothetical protein COLO4_35612 [Corchorus olitorius]|uniref:Uncharacterized protein n=1 Tax=Corchorus olitorius TaxID=93759 RepID=A0A1R3GEQ0_9ROSI|nr:hypothetical protein COLO4_35612 [Corchorus olitorius]